MFIQKHSQYLSAPNLWRNYCFSLVSTISLSPNRDLSVFNMLACLTFASLPFSAISISHVLVFKKIIFILVYFYFL